MVRTAIFGGLGALGVLLLYRNFVAPSTPDRAVLFAGSPWEISTDDIGLAVGMALLAPALTSVAHKVVPG